MNKANISQSVVHHTRTFLIDKPVIVACQFKAVETEMYIAY